MKIKYEKPLVELMLIGRKNTIYTSGEIFSLNDHNGKFIGDWEGIK